jgi:hypothetical protein
MPEPISQTAIILKNKRIPSLSRGNPGFGALAQKSRYFKV